MTGQAQMIRLFAQAVRDQPFTKRQLEIGNMSRMTTIPPLEHGEKRLDFPKNEGQSRLNPGDQDGASEPTTHLSWKNAKFSTEKLPQIEMRRQ